MSVVGQTANPAVLLSCAVCTQLARPLWGLSCAFPVAVLARVLGMGTWIPVYNTRQRRPTLMAIWLVIVPEGQKRAASWPNIWAAFACCASRGVG